MAADTTGIEVVDRREHPDTASVAFALRCKFLFASDTFVIRVGYGEEMNINEYRAVRGG
jgi:23S rRNA U2552 (ribose-2'-O)-methylase RlmE/FtsJ